MAQQNTHYWPQVLQAVPGDNFTVYAYFSDGSIRLFDVKPLIYSGSVFEPLADVETFASRITVMNDTVAWDIQGDGDTRHCLDLDPFTIYESMAVVDPLAEAG
ncbi:MAG: DUF2442 domain-containing protein [Coriobacteriales bacterium]|jgi:hypothetical protein|nr:DUF2442 domain-containing protein [Coriobacteriales bacterium]